MRSFGQPFIAAAAVFLGIVCQLNILPLSVLDRDDTYM